MDENVFTGKTVDDAVDAGLKALGITLADAEIEVLEEGKKKLFGSVKARVRITVKQSEDAPVLRKAAVKVEEDEVPFVAAASAAESEEPAEEDEEQAEVPAEAEAATETAETETAPAEDEVDTTAADAARAAEFINGILPLLRIEGEAEVLPENEDGSISITINTSATYKVIGKRGDVLDAIQCIAGAVANIGRDKYKKVVVDCENYRETRKESLERLAHKLEKKAIETGRKIILEPMNPYERRIIHSALTDSPDVTTMSEGKEPNRYVVVIPSNAKPYDKGIKYSSSHSNGPQRGGRGGYSNGHGGRPSGGSRGNFNRDRQSSGRPSGSRPYDRDSRDNRGGNGGYNRDRDNRGGNGGYNRDRDSRGPRDNRDREARGPRDSRDNRDRGSRPSSAPRKKEIHFGAYLGNSNDTKKDN